MCVRGKESMRERKIEDLCEYVCVCVCVREREIESVCACVCVRVCVILCASRFCAS